MENESGKSGNVQIIKREALPNEVQAAIKRSEESAVPTEEPAEIIDTHTPAMAEVRAAIERASSQNDESTT